MNNNTANTIILVVIFACIAAGVTSCNWRVVELEKIQFEREKLEKVKQ